MISVMSSHASTNRDPLFARKTEKTFLFNIYFGFHKQTLDNLDSKVNQALAFEKQDCLKWKRGPMDYRNELDRLPIGDNPPFDVNCFVEIPKGCTNKYEYDKENGVFKLDRVLYEAVFFPTEYGFIPQTLNEEDGDPQDIMVLSTFPTFPGCLISCRPIGVIRMIDTKQEDYKIVAVPDNDPRFNEIKDLGDLSAHTKKEIKNFLENYSELQPEKKIKIEGWSGKEKAHDIIKEAIKNYKEKKASKNK